jgi:hypothetical protein
MAALALLLAAWYNGFPLLFSDSGEYFARSVVLLVPEYRSFGYPLFLAAVWPQPSLWAGVIAQSLLLGAVLHLLVRALAPDMTWKRYVRLLVILALATAAPWTSGQLMPDVFAPITVIAVYLVTLHWAELSRVARALLLVAIAVGVTTHATHLALAVGMLAVCAAVAWRKRVAQVWRGVGRAAAAVATGMVVLLTIDFAQTGELFFSRGGSVYMLAHLIDAGFAQKILREDCPAARYALCPFQDRLPRDVANFLWSSGSPLPDIGGAAGAADETRRLLPATIRRYPAQFFLSTLTYTGRQLVAVWTFDGLQSYARVWYVHDFILQFRPDELRSFATARQQRGVFQRDHVIPGLHEAILAVAALASLWLLARAWRRRQLSLSTADGFQLMVWIVLVANAALCANLSGVFDRYQTRLAWLLPLAVLISLDARRQRDTLSSSE